MDLRIDWARKAHARGWHLTPLSGKKPRLDAWQKRDMPALEQVEAWAKAGNVGIVTGEKSDVFILDFDFPKLVAEIDTAPDAASQKQAEDYLAAARRLHSALPKTVTVITGTDGEHKYFRSPRPCPPNTAGTLTRHVDTRGDGGQCVFPGSTHPETNRPYVWAPGLSPDDVDVAQLPDDLLEQLRPKPAPPPTPAPRPSTSADTTKYGSAALEGITRAIASAPAGSRNATLNREGFAAWQLYFGGEIKSAIEVEEALYSAAVACGLVATDGEASVRATIRSARKGGEAAPRSAPPRPERRGLHSVSGNRGGQRDAEVNEPEAGAGLSGERTQDGATHEPAPEPPEVLIPGLHPGAAGDIEIGNDDFVHTALSSLPPGTIYRRGDVPGVILGDAGERVFLRLTIEGMRIVLDRHLKLCKWVKRKIDATPWVRFETTTSDHARLVLEAAATHPSVRSLKHLVSYPVFLQDLTLALTGWNELGGVFYDCPAVLEQLVIPGVERTRIILEDLTVDFPWKKDGPEGRTSSSRENFYGLLLTPMLRPAIIGNIPLHLILSTIPRSGKSLLAEQIVGGTYIGKPTPARHLGVNEEERQKSIISMLLQADTLVHLDNLRDFLDSAHIASLLTSTEYSGRRLGVNDTRPLPNNLILIASGNNVRATEEIVKRTVPVWLSPSRDDPENRTDFEHPDLTAYVAEKRRDVIAALVGMVIRWRDGERVLGPWPKGGFERWAELVGGVLLTNGFGVWRSNERAWQRSADTFGEDFRTLCTAWWERFAGAKTTTSEVLTIVEETGVFPHVMKAESRTGKLMSLSKSVLRKHLDAPIARWFLRQQGSGSSSFFYLEEIP